MTYWSLNLIFLAAIGLLAVVALVLGRAPRWRAVAVVVLTIVVLTAIFDNVIILAGLVGYHDDLISGLFVGVAPLEDFAYAIAAAVLLPTLWALLGAGRKADRR